MKSTIDRQIFSIFWLNRNAPTYEPAMPPARATPTIAYIAGSKISPCCSCPPNPEIELTKINSALTAAACFMWDQPRSTNKGDKIMPLIVSHVGDAVVDYTCVNRYRILRMYKAVDGCGNTSTCLQSIRVNDEIAPVGICPEIKVSCVKDIPCGADDPKLAAVIAQIKTAYAGPCDEDISVEYTSHTIPKACSYEEGKGYAYRDTFYFLVKDACGNASSCMVTFSAACFCTYTQGFWGNANGKANGLTTIQILDTLMKYGPVYVGDSINCGFALPSTACILGVLPAGGASNPLGKNYQVNCNKTIKNTLVGQLVALQLNIRYNAHFRSLRLDSMVLTGACALSPSLLDTLGLGDTSTVAELITLANQYLASTCTGKVFPNGFGGMLASALGGLNEFWDECRTEQPCPGLGYDIPGIQDRGNTVLALQEEVQIIPNPASATLTVRFVSENASRQMLRIFDSGGRLVQVLSWDAIAGANSIPVDVSNYSPGIYWISLASPVATVTKRFVVYRE